MYKNKKIVAIIPARGGSKGIPKKNIRVLCGKPLIVWTIEQALNSKYIDEVYVSTDNKEIADISKGAKIIKRPKSISKDNSSTESALLHASKYLNNDYDIMILLQCTSPLRYTSQIEDAIKKFFEENADSLLTGYINDKFYWDFDGKSLNYDYKNRPRRQEKEWEFVENGSFYIFKKDILLKNKNRLGGKISHYIMPKWMSFEIDEYFDFQLIEYLMKNKYKNDNIIKNKISKIKMILFDVDGVFTDGAVYLTEKGEEMLKFSRVDGKGIELLRKKGYLLGVISSEDSEIVRKRMNKLKIPEIHLGIKNKLLKYEELKKKYNIIDEQICFCGDDIQDIAILKKVGLACCPDNAQEEVKKVCGYISNKKGGEGFIRDTIKKVIK